MHDLSMITGLAERRSLAVGVSGGVALMLGSMVGLQPRAATGMVVALLVAMVAIAAPTASLVSLLFLTAIVPYGIQNRFGMGGSGLNSPGLLLSDVLLLLGLGMAVLALQRMRLSRRELVVAASVAAFLGLAVLQLLHGLRLGRGVGQAGGEFRSLLGFAGFLIALPILNQPGLRKRLLVSLLGLAVALGLWGIVQWVGHLGFEGDVGVRPGVRLTTTGTGQLQGGLFGFPVAIVACYAVLLGGAVRSRAAKASLAAAMFLNAVSLLLTFERTFWVATVAGLLVVTLKAGSLQRLKSVLLLPLLFIVLYAALSVVAPVELTTARQRLSSLKYGTVDRYRVEESDHVRTAIVRHPIVGSGLAATIFWGRPWAQVPAKSYAYSHNGYLWLAWKIGVPAAALLVILLGVAVLLRGPPGEGALEKSIRGGAQASLAALLVASVTFPSFRELSITPVMGLLLALAVVPLTARTEA